MAKATAEARRPLASRSSTWARYLAARLTASRVTPNQVSFMSIVWAVLGGALLLIADRAKPPKNLPMTMTALIAAADAD
jgi:hypothetical protein